MKLFRSKRLNQLIQKAEEPESNNSSDLNQNLNIVDSYPDARHNDINFQQPLHIPLTNEIEFKILIKPFRTDEKHTFPN